MKTSRKVQLKTKTKTCKRKGGKVFASGAYGCVFSPALKCKDASSREPNKVSKLMIEENANDEYENINYIHEKLRTIPNYQKYFIINDITLCEPHALTSSDLTEFGTKCGALTKNNYTRKNINEKLDKLKILNIPHGGLPVDDFVYTNGDYEKLYRTHMALVKLLKKGIMPMNSKNIYHSDIKDSNILIDPLYNARLIDWGLTEEYIPGRTVKFPHKWRNRPLQYNVPFSVIIFTDQFYQKYSNYLTDGGIVDEEHLRPFVVEYTNGWIEHRGAGHFNFIHEIMVMLYKDTVTDVSEDEIDNVIKTEITMPYITDYIVEVLVHYTKFKPDGTLNLREYLHDVYIKIVDIWGFLLAYYPFLEMFSNNYASLNENELKIFKQLQFIYNEYLYTPRSTPIDMTELLDDLKILGNLIHIVKYGKRKTTSSSSSSIANETEVSGL